MYTNYSPNYRTVMINCGKLGRYSFIDRRMQKYCIKFSLHLIISSDANKTAKYYSN